MRRALAQDQNSGSLKLDSETTAEIQRAIEMVKWVQFAKAEEIKKALRTIEGNTYILPKPLSLRASNLT